VIVKVIVGNITTSVGLTWPMKDKGKPMVKTFLHRHFLIFYWPQKLLDESYVTFVGPGSRQKLTWTP
jgi:hypothetical protein